MTGLKKMKKGLAGIVLFFTVLSVGWAADGIISFADSGNWSAGNTSYLSLDDYIGTYAQLSSGSEYGWIEYELDADSRIAGVTLNAEIPEDAWISIAFDDAGVRKIVPTSFRTDINGEFFVNLLDSGIVTDHLSLIIEGPAAYFSEIYDFKPKTLVDTESSVSAELTLIDQSSNTPYYYDASFLVDGVVGTEWRTLPGYYNSGWDNSNGKNGHNSNRSVAQIPASETDFEKESQGLDDYTARRGGLNNGLFSQKYAEFQVEEPAIFDNSSIYIKDGASGTLIVSVYYEEAYHDLDVIDMWNSSGWASVSMPEDQIIEKVKLQLTGRSYSYGGVGEIELRRHVEVENKKQEDLISFKDISENGYGIFSLSEDELGTIYELTVVIDSDTDYDSVPVLVNGLNVFQVEAAHYGTVKCYSIEMDRNLLNEGNNFVAVTPGDGGRALSAVCRLRSDEDTLYFSEKLAGYGKSINFEDEINVSELEIFSDLGSNFQVRLLGSQGVNLPDNSITGEHSIKMSFETPVRLTDVEITGEDGLYSLEVRGAGSTEGEYIRILPREDDSGNTYESNFLLE